MSRWTLIGAGIAATILVIVFSVVAMDEVDFVSEADLITLYEEVGVDLPDLSYVNEHRESMLSALITPSVTTQDIIDICNRIVAGERRIIENKAIHPGQYAIALKRLWKREIPDELAPQWLREMEGEELEFTTNIWRSA